MSWTTKVRHNGDVAAAFETPIGWVERDPDDPSSYPWRATCAQCGEMMNRSETRRIGVLHLLNHSKRNHLAQMT